MRAVLRQRGHLRLVFLLVSGTPRLALGGVFDAAAELIDCGVLRGDDSHARLGDGLPLACGERAETDCVSLALLFPRGRNGELVGSGPCPSSCPYVAPDPYLSCVFQCTTAPGCSAVNAAFAHPNNATSVCEPCSVVGCRRCSSPDVCAECFDNFWLELGGRVCAYVWDDRAQHGVHAVAALCAALVLLVSAVFAIVDHCACCGRCLPQEVSAEEGDEEEEEEPEDATPDGGGSPVRHRFSDFGLDPLTRAVNQGKLHRLRCKVKDLDFSSSKRVQADGRPVFIGGSPGQFRKIPFWVDLRSRFLVGVGLPLFHQWYYFIFLYSLLMCAGAAWVYYGSPLSIELQRIGFDHASHFLLGDDAMRFCARQGRGDHLHLGTAVQEFARRSSVGYFVMWAAGLVLALAHAYRQKWVAAEFYQKHPCLAEFVLNVEGFPADATDEAKIRDFLRAAFGSESLEVSVCYDYRSRRDRVHELLEKVLVQQDVLSGTYDASLAAPPVERRQTGLGLTEDNKKEVRSWLEPGTPDGLRNAGSVFAVLPHNYDLMAVRQRFSDVNINSMPLPVRSSQQPKSQKRLPMLPHESTPEWLPPLKSGLQWVGADGKIYPLVIRDMVCEPPDVVWDHMGLETSKLAWRLVGGGLVILVSFVTLAAVVFVPLASYSINYVSKAGSTPTGVLMTLLGVLVMSANWLIGLLHIKVSSLVGFARRDREGLMLFKVFSLLCLVSFLFNVAITIFPGTSRDPLRYLLHPLGSDRLIASMQEISFQVRASVHLFHVLVPGSLFIGYLIFPLQGFVWPFVSTLTFLRLWHSRGFGPHLSARKAELSLEPLGMSIGHDYMGHIVQPMSCMLTLFFASGVAWQTFACLALWSVFMMPFMRYMHLRAVRRCYFTTNRIDSEALLAWGLPHSMVLAASCFWEARLRGWPMHLVPLAWLASNALYASLLCFCIRPFSPPKDQGLSCHRPNYDEVRARRYYDWHNCNPIKVLLSHCTEGVDPIPPFEVGKEYLQANDPKFETRIRKATHSYVTTEMTTVFQEEAAWGWMPSLHVPEVETLIQRPIDAFNIITSSVTPAPQRGGAGTSSASLDGGRRRKRRSGSTGHADTSAAPSQLSAAGSELEAAGRTLDLASVTELATSGRSAGPVERQDSKEGLRSGPSALDATSGAAQHTEPQTGAPLE